ncbi:hypothetical protein A3C89_04200 [Candidatus Kaiserbacteria bacterium RIFCSPHIGHO2_02_FULL_50_50]|uniref:DUF5666 domain-containing protein n=1 Tax=Candidatus Kaiserbacteria bacterium RIFCSPHIGHO2_02_FULL_50_50 TaxID=1798492 RepID=A0A1F6DGK9_9BACT|nr:MAG: hypothetical protein A3C89_04200 [Candidatus Kaiserbacteria bacterium RIFCSPHIGHO2_02_FULL_50_50]
MKLMNVWAIALSALMGMGTVTVASAADGARAWGSTTKLSPKSEVTDLALKEHMLREELLGSRTTMNHYGDNNMTSNTVCASVDACQTQDSSVTSVNGSTFTSVSSSDQSSVGINTTITTGQTDQTGTAQSNSRVSGNQLIIK